MSVRVQHIRGTTTEVEAATPQTAELGYDTTKKEAHIGDGATAGGLRLAKKNIAEVLTPSQITSNQNNYSPTGMKHAQVLRISTDASRDITGIVPTTVTDSTDGRILMLHNVGSFAAVLKDQSASSTAANRFDLGGNDISIGTKQSAVLRYDNTTSRWQMVAHTAGASIGDDSVSARTLGSSAIGGAGMINGTLVTSVAGNAVTFAIKTLAGGDPSPTDPTLFRFPVASGGYIVREVSAALSLTVTSGSSLGVTATVPFAIWSVALDDAGTVRLGVVNCATSSGMLSLNPMEKRTTTAEGGAGGADSNGTIYTGTAIATPRYMIPLAYHDWNSGLATAGTWNVNADDYGLWQPGMPLPGQLTGNNVQAVSTTISTISSTATLTASSLTATINVKRAANRVSVAWSCSYAISAAAAKKCAFQTMRAGVGFGPPLPAYLAASGVAIGPAAKQVVDAPGTVGNVTYAVGGFNEAASTTLQFPYDGVTGISTPGGDIVLSEIMG